VVGIIFIFSAPTAGFNAGDAAVRDEGMDTNQFERVIDGVTASYQLGGFAISLVGGFGVLLSGYSLYREM